MPKGSEVEDSDEGSGPMNGVDSEYKSGFQENDDGEEETHGYGGELFV